MRIAAISIALVGLVAFVGFGAYAIDAGIQESKQSYSVTNETFVPDGGNVTVLNKSELSTADYDGSVTVRDANGSEVPASGNYSWLESDGTVQTVDNSYLDTQSSATISYGWYGQTETQTVVSDLAIQQQSILRTLIIAGAIGLVVAGLVAAGRVA